MERVTIDGIQYDVLSSSQIVDPGLAMHPGLAAGWKIRGIEDALIVGRKGMPFQWLVYKMADGTFKNPTQIR